MIIFKPEIAPSDICRVCPYVRIVLSYVEAYAIDNDINDGVVTVTSIMSDRDSGIHEDGRAVDISIKGDWTSFHCNRLKHQLNKKFGAEWGTKPSELDVPPRVLVYDRTLADGSKDHLDHLHLQVRRNIIYSFD